MQWIGFGFEAINRWQFANDLTWIKGKHSIKVGDEFRLHRFNFHGWAASTGGSFNFSRLGTGAFDASGNALASTGDPFASFLLVRCRPANYTIPAYTSWNGTYSALFINDDYKVTSRLTLTLGLRFDYQSAWTERYNRFSTFDPSLATPGPAGVPEPWHSPPRTTVNSTILRRMRSDRVSASVIACEIKLCCAAVTAFTTRALPSPMGIPRTRDSPQIHRAQSD